MSEIVVRQITDDEMGLYDELMRVTGGHVREEYHTRLAEWRAEAPLMNINYFGEFGASSPASIHDGPVFSVFRYEEATQVYRDFKTFSSETVRNSAGRAFGQTIITEDPPEHKAIRKLTQPLFTRKAVESWVPDYFEPAFKAHLDSIYERGEADLFHELLLPYPVAVIHQLMGIEAEGEKADRFHQLALQIFLIRGPDPALGLKALELTAYYFPKTTPEYLKSIRERCDKLEIAVSGTAVGNDFCNPDKKHQAEQLDMVKRWVDHSAVLGARTIRIFAGTLRKGDTEDEARRRAIDLIHKACDHAAKAKIFLALENHGGITATADQFLSIVKAVKHDWFGVNLDTGNFHTPDPYADLAKAAPYAVVVQIKTEIFPGKWHEQADRDGTGQTSTKGCQSR